jgi:hypothetical protein
VVLWKQTEKDEEETRPKKRSSDNEACIVTQHNGERENKDKREKTRAKRQRLHQAFLFGPSSRPGFVLLLLMTC